jgi:hypothetical protein
VVGNVKFRSSLIRIDPFTAENAGQKEDRLDDIKLGYRL